LAVLVFASSREKWWRTVKEERGKRCVRKDKVLRGDV